MKKILLSALLSSVIIFVSGDSNEKKTEPSIISLLGKSAVNKKQQKIKPLATNKKYPLSQLVRYMKRKHPEHSENPEKLFFILLQRKSTRLATTKVKLKNLDQNQEYVLKEDDRQIKRLIKRRHLTIQDKNSYQKIMSYFTIVIKRGKRTSRYKLYLENPWPGKQRPDGTLPAHAIIATYDIVSA